MAGASICFDVGPLRDMVKDIGWYGGLRRDVETSQSIIVVSAGEYRREISKSRQILRWLSQLEKSGRVRSILAEKVDECVELITTEPEAVCQECDDHHLFAICHLGRASYLFTQDDRLAKCRTKMKKSAKLRRFCVLKIIGSEKVYKRHREKII